MVKGDQEEKVLARIQAIGGSLRAGEIKTSRQLRKRIASLVLLVEELEKLSL